MHEWKVKVKSLNHVQLLATRGLQPTRLLHPWDFPGKSTGVGCHCLLRYRSYLIPKKAAWKKRGKEWFQSKENKQHFSQVIKVNNNVILLVYTLDRMWREWHFTSVVYPKSCCCHLIMRKANQTNLNWGEFYKILDQYPSTLPRTPKTREVCETVTEDSKTEL